MKKNKELALEWLKRAKSSLEKAKVGKFVEDILYEDLGFDAQQAVEKSLKALLLLHKIPFPKTHAISELITLLMKEDVDIPEQVKESASLTDYAVTTRYPGDWESITEEEYEEAVKLAEFVYQWVNRDMEEREEDENN